MKSENVSEGKKKEAGLDESLPLGDACKGKESPKLLGGAKG